MWPLTMTPIPKIGSAVSHGALPNSVASIALPCYFSSILLQIQHKRGATMVKITVAIPQLRGFLHCALGFGLFLAGSVLPAQDLSETAAKQSPEEVVSIEQSLQRNPDDLKSREILITYYTL